MEVSNIILSLYKQTANLADDLVVRIETSDEILNQPSGILVDPNAIVTIPYHRLLSGNPVLRKWDFNGTFIMEG